MNKNTNTSSNNKFNYPSNPFNFYKTNESDDESSPEPKEKPQKPVAKKKKSIEQQQKKPKVNGPKINDFLKFRKSDQYKSESESESVEEIKEKPSKKPLNKYVENRKINKNNDMFNQYTNYFFDENALNEIKKIINK